jgi:hypothetical protein
MNPLGIVVVNNIVVICCQDEPVSDELVSDCVIAPATSVLPSPCLSYYIELRWLWRWCSVLSIGWCGAWCVGRSCAPCTGGLGSLRHGWGAGLLQGWLVALFEG